MTFITELLNDSLQENEIETMIFLFFLGYQSQGP